MAKAITINFPDMELTLQPIADTEAVGAMANLLACGALMVKAGEVVHYMSPSKLIDAHVTMGPASEPGPGPG